MLHTALISSRFMVSLFMCYVNNTYTFILDTQFYCSVIHTISIRIVFFNSFFFYVVYFCFEIYKQILNQVQNEPFWYHCHLKNIHLHTFFVFMFSVCNVPCYVSRLRFTLMLQAEIKFKFKFNIFFWIDKDRSIFKVNSWIILGILFLKNKGWFVIVIQRKNWESMQLVYSYRLQTPRKKTPVRQASYFL